MPKSLSFRLMSYLGMALFILCPLTFLAGTFAPRTLGFLDGVMCPEGAHLGKAESQQLDEEGNQVTAVAQICTGPDGTVTDITVRMLALLFSLPVLGTVVYVVRERLFPQSGAAKSG